MATRPEFASHRRKLEYEDRGTDCRLHLAELKTLRCRERLEAKLRPESASYDGRFDAATWEEMIELAAAGSAARGQIETRS